jgi:general secretion pathway protein K
MRRPHGAALLLVLWIVLLLSALVAGYALSARIESLQGNGSARQLVAREAARAGVEYAVSRLLEPDPARRWPVDGRPQRFVFAGLPVEVAVRDEAGRIDLNAASPELLRDFFVALGEPPATAMQLAAAVVDFRDPDSLTQPVGGAEDADYIAAGLPWGAKDAPFEDVAELQQVLGMRLALYRRAAPHLTVFSGRALPEVGVADPLVRQVLHAPAAEAAMISPASGSGTYSIDSRARLPDGRGAQMHVVIRLGGSGLPGAIYTPLHWQVEGGWQ